MYAAIRQGKAKTGKSEELARRIKEGAIPIISDVEGFMAYYVVYAPDDTVTAISLFNNHAGAEEANRRALAWIEQDLAPLLVGPATAMAGPVSEWVGRAPEVWTNIKEKFAVLEQPLAAARQRTVRRVAAHPADCRGGQQAGQRDGPADLAAGFYASVRHDQGRRPQGTHPAVRVLTAQAARPEQRFQVAHQGRGRGNPQGPIQF